MSGFCTEGFSVSTNAVNGVWSLYVASARQDQFVFTGFLAPGGGGGGTSLQVLNGDVRSARVCFSGFLS